MQVALCSRKHLHKSQGLPDAEVVRVIWGCILRSINMTGKNQSQILQSIVRAIKTYHKLLATYVVNGRLELSLLVSLQVGVCFFGGGVPARCCLCIPSLSGSFSYAPSHLRVTKHPRSRVTSERTGC